ncbi:MAG: hypothetical protein CML73_00435 [Rhodobiaceae bacterium]|nr:hypothetical protein [Rhodobiaceae bacterium]
MTEVGDWCTCPAFYKASFLKGGWKCVKQQALLAVFSGVVAGAEALITGAVCIGLGPGTGLLEAGCVMLVGAEGILDGKILDVWEGPDTIAMNTGSYPICAFDHGIGGTGLSVCENGCNFAGNKATTGCDNKQWCGPNTKLRPGTSCECPAADNPYICVPPGDSFCSGANRPNYMGGCNNNDGITCETTLAVWNANLAGGLNCGRT